MIPLPRRSSAKPLVACALALPMILFPASAHADPPQSGAPVTENAPIGRNVALRSEGAVATASGTEVTDGRWTAESLNDGVVNPEAPSAQQSRWSSDYSDSAWATVTFARPQVIDHVTLHWEAACAASYHLEVSTDGETFIPATESIRPTCGTKTAAAVDVRKLTEVDSSTPYKAIRMQAEERTPVDGILYGVSLWEFEAWTGPEPVPEAPAPRPALIPLPADFVDESEAKEAFSLAARTRIVASDEALAAAELLAPVLRASTGFPVDIVRGGERAGDIIMTTGDVPGRDGDEAYSLVSDSQGVRITARADHGFFNATQTLRQLLPGFIESPSAVQSPWEVPAVSISDAPRYDYRSVMIDPARSFITVEEVKALIDQMSSLKMNHLHIHLADDQGWRIEITNEGRADGDDIDYTMLTGISGRTAMNTHEQAASGELGRTGFYTQDDYRAIVAYAAARHVTIIPEIDVPGHTNAALHAIAQLNTAGSSHEASASEPTAPANGTGAVGYSYLDPDSEVTYTFIAHVIEQLASLTPGQYIHVGGDEPHSLTQRYGQDVYNSTLKRIGEIVRAQGKSPMGWSEYANTTLSAGDAVQYWIGSTEPIRRAIENEGAKVVVSRGASSYIDQKYNPKTPIGLTWACSGSCDVREYYSWDPAAVIPGVADSGILGNEAPLWSETVRGGDQNQFLIWPRAAAHAEIGWSEQSDRDVDDFVSRMAGAGAHWTAMGANFYDTPQVDWKWEFASETDMRAPSGRPVVLPLGRIVAPGTKADENTISADTTDDVDGTSKSTVPDGMRVMVDWGDGSPVEPASFVADEPRSEYGAPGVYRLLGTHAYAPGTHTITITAAEQVRRLTVEAAEGAPDPVLPPTWDSSQTPSANADESRLEVLQRVKVVISGFEPDRLVDVKIGDALLGRLRPDETGRRTHDLLIAPGVRNGDQTLEFVQGDRKATVQVEISGGTIPLPDRLGTDRLKLVAVDSQELHAEAPPNGPGQAALDGDPHTFWHTAWKDAKDPFPHHIIVQALAPEGNECTITAAEYTGRAGEENSRAKSYELYVSEDGADWGDAVAKGDFSNSSAPQVVLLEKPQRGCFVKLVELDSQNGEPFGGAAEFAVGATFAPTGSEESIELSRTSVARGESFTIMGRGYAPGTGVTATLHSDPILIGTKEADADGTVEFEYTIGESMESGPHTVTLTNERTGHRVHAAIDVTAAPSAPAPDAPGALPGSSGGASEQNPSVLASTGAAVAPFLAAATALVSTGVLLTRSIRRRRA